MNRSLFVASAALLLAVVAACSSNNSNSDGGTGGSGGSGGSGSTCTNPTTSSTDGTTPCTDVTCTANQHCDAMGGIQCYMGCANVNNCAQGEYCDLSAGAHDIEGTPSGTCRTPTPCTTNTGGSGGSGSGSGGTVYGCLAGGTSNTTACGMVETCVESSCDDELKAAFGNDYASGTVGGACSAFYECISAAGCTTDAQQSCASMETTECKSDISGVSSCVQSKCGSQVSACNQSLIMMVNGGTDGGTP